MVKVLVALQEDKANNRGGVKIMSCQVFSGSKGCDLYQEAKAVKYAADNGAVILQCSWGYNSGLSNPISGYTRGLLLIKIGSMLLRWKKKPSIIFFIMPVRQTMS